MSVFVIIMVFMATIVLGEILRPSSLFLETTAEELEKRIKELHATKIYEEIAANGIVKFLNPPQNKEFQGSRVDRIIEDEK